MRRKRLLLATTALGAVLGCSGKKQQHPIRSNPKGTHYDKGLDAGVADAPPDLDLNKPPDPEEVHGNPKGSFYDDGLAKPPAR